MLNIKFDWDNHGSIDIQPLCIKHINLEIHFSRVPRYKSWIDELFSYFHPQTLLVRLSPNALKQNFIQVFCNGITSFFNLVFFPIFTYPCFSLYLFYEFVGAIGWTESREKCGKWYKCNKYRRWCYFLKDFKILESTARQGVHQIISLEFQW